MAASAVLSALLSACGPSPTPTPRPRATASPRPPTPVVFPTPTATARPAATQLAAEARPSSFTWALEGDPGSFDAHVATSLIAVSAYEHVYEGLTSLDDAHQPVGALAARFEPIRDGYGFQLQIDGAARFHDGAEVTSDDVKWSFDRLLSADLRSVWATSWFEPIKDVTVLDRKSVRIVLKRPYPQLPAILGSMRGGLIFPREIDRKIDLRQHALGSGPFRLREYVPGDRIVYERHGGFREPGVPVIPGMIARILPDEGARVAALRSGAVDVAPLSVDGVAQLGSAPDVRVVAAPSGRNMLLELPYHRVPAFRDARVRRAVSLALDRKALIQKAVLGAGQVSGFIPVGFGDWGLPETELNTLVARDLEQARRLLAEAGYPGGQGFPTVRLMAVAQLPETITTARLVQAQLRDVGLELEVSNIEWGAYVALFAKGDVELGLLPTEPYPDPDLYLWPQAHSRSANGQRGYRHAAQSELDRLLDQVRGWTGTREERREAVRGIDRMLLADPPVVPLFSLMSLEGISTRVRGYTPTFSGRRQAFRRVTLA